MKKILIIEDNLSNAEMISSVFTEEGFATRALTGPQGLAEMLDIFEPDLILMDILLAGADGRELCNELRANKKTAETKIILMTAALLHQIPDIPCQHDGIVTKPFDIFDLLKKVNEMLE
ncbi:response regulator [Pedobacter sp. CFBP9032]|uniref:response regulator n=1 Tax=Pedobacter sp. CFBP9032 TaxID=3096539 RepID=UPI002A6B11F9|nr:response regulator [Pedobacter sp. CFBP9032]MDY0904953.1 response regulator [Pedobacter sp. CFBP9032]